MIVDYQAALSLSNELSVCSFPSLSHNVMHVHVHVHYVHCAYIHVQYMLNYYRIPY